MQISFYGKYFYKIPTCVLGSKYSITGGFVLSSPYIQMLLVLVKLPVSLKGELKISAT
jgi:hypothetical protein